MPIPIKQVPSLILPRVWTTGAETETVRDVLEHTSTEFPCESLYDKTVVIMAMEVALAPAAIPGPLWMWIELSPVPSINNGYWAAPLPVSTFFWAAIGGGGGAIAPTAPIIEVSGLAGAAGTLVHNIMIPWAIHSVWTRVVVQTPVAAALPDAYWLIQVLINGASK